LLVQYLVYFLEIHHPDIALEDIALLVDQKGGGCQLDVTEGLGNAALAIQGDKEGQLVFCTKACT
jgi:hypothetical protein